MIPPKFIEHNKWGEKTEKWSNSNGDDSKSSEKDETKKKVSAQDVVTTIGNVAGAVSNYLQSKDQSKGGGGQTVIYQKPDDKPKDKKSRNTLILVGISVLLIGTGIFVYMRSR